MPVIEYGARTVLWITALLSTIVWVLGLSSGFLGPLIHVFLLTALLAGLGAIVPRHAGGPDNETSTTDAPPPEY